MKVGDKVKIVRIPQYLTDDGVMNTKSVFEKCLGHVFRIRGFEKDWLELNVGKVTGKRFETIWIEPECVELVSD
jgi:hypothetical protein